MLSNVALSVFFPLSANRREHETKYWGEAMTIHVLMFTQGLNENKFFVLSVKCLTCKMFIYLIVAFIVE